MKSSLKKNMAKQVQKEMVKSFKTAFESKIGQEEDGTERKLQDIDLQLPRSGA